MTSYGIFQEPWWLDAVAGGSWRALEVTHGAEIVARLPIVSRRLYGFTIIRQPPLTPTLGPWLRPSQSTPSKRLAEQKELFDALIDQLPSWDFIELNFNHRLANWLPFHWRGFKQTTRYTYLLDDLSDLNRIWQGLQDSIRRHIKKAERIMVVRDDLPLDRLLDMVELTFARQGSPMPFRRELVRRIDQACSARQARHMLFAEDTEGRLHAALYLVMDGEYAYYLLGGADPALRSSGAQSLLFWEAIKRAAARQLKFDFEGSMIESIERVFRGFGAVQTPYLQVYAARPVAGLLLQLCPPHLLKRLAGL